MAEDCLFGFTSRKIMTTCMRPKRELSSLWSGPRQRLSTATSSLSNQMSGPSGFCSTRSWRSDRCLTQVSLFCPPVHVFGRMSLYVFLWACLTVCCDCCRHDKPAGGPEGPAGLQDDMSSPLPQSRVWHHDGLLEGERTEPSHIWDPAVEAGGLFWRGRDVLRWRQPLLAAEEPCWWSHRCF